MNVIDSFVEITLPDAESFLKVAETLTRIGIASNKTKTLWQSCHILHKQGKYYIPHFKEMFLLDGKETNISNDDIARRNTIIKLLSDWGLVTVVNPALIESSKAPVNQIKIIPFADKPNWVLSKKYTLGVKK